MTAWQVILPWLIPMAALIVVSAFFSGSEAALFSLRPRDRRTLQRRPGAGRVATFLLQSPERLLSAILFWNLMVNMVYFGIASIVGGRLEQTPGGGAAAIVFTVASLLVIIFCSEMLPKSLGVVSPLRLVNVIARPMALAVRIVSPALPLISLANLATRRLLWPSFEPEADLELTDIERAIELGTGDAMLVARERALLQQLVQMADTSVGEWMRPRSQLQLETLPDEHNKTLPAFPGEGYLYFTEAGRDEIVAAAAPRRLRPNQWDDLLAAIEPVIFVPWSAKVSKTFDLMIQQERHVAGVVNEYGETIGVLTMDDIFRQLLAGPDRDAHHRSGPIMEEVEPDVWQVAGNASARRLAKRLNVPRPEGRNVTVAGLMQRLNERVPRHGDRCDWEGYVLEVIDEDEEGMPRIEVRQRSSRDADEANR